MLSSFSSIAQIVSSLVGVPVAFAITLPNAPCAVGQQFGCNGLATNMVMQALAVGPFSIAVTMLQLAAGLAVLFIVWAGIQMIISLGDEGKITQQKWAMAYALIGLSVSILSQFVISSVGTQNYGQLSGGTTNLPFIVLANVTTVLRLILNALFVMMVAIAALRMLYAQGKADEFNTGKKMLYWGLAGAVLVNLSAALVYAVANFFGVL